MVTEIQYPNYGNALLTGMRIRNAMDSRKNTQEIMDRKRLEWDRSDKAETASKLKQAQDDFLKGLSHFNPEDPGFDQDFDMWKSWYQKRNPDYAQMIDDTFQGMDSESIRFAARQAKKQMVRKTEKLNPGDTLVDSSTGETVAQGSQ